MGISKSEFTLGKIGVSYIIQKPFCHYVIPDGDIEKILKLLHANIPLCRYCSRYKFLTVKATPYTNS